MAKSTIEALTLPRGPVDLASYDPRATPGFTAGQSNGKKNAKKSAKKKGKAALFSLGEELSDLQERLFAEGRSGGTRSLLFVLQGMDTSGKGGLSRHSFALVDPQGVVITSFKAPSRNERRHDFLWRIEKQVPRAGFVGV